LRAPAGPGVRDDGGYDAGDEVPIFYDSLVSKLTVWGEDRRHAIARMRRALAEYEVAGIRTTLPFFGWLLAQPEFLEGRVDTTFLDGVLAGRNGQPFAPPSAELEDLAAVAAAIHAASRSAADGPSSPSQGAWARAARIAGLR
jgi:acetyl-CoA carboxylase biotin carboxylase subunit